MALGIQEAELTGARALDLKSVLVDEAMVMAAEEDEIGKGSGAAISPVEDVMRLGEAEPAAGEPAPPIPDLESAPDGGRDGPGSPAHVQNVAVGGGSGPDDAGIAAEAPGRFS